MEYKRKQKTCKKNKIWDKDYFDIIKEIFKMKSRYTTVFLIVLTVFFLMYGTANARIRVVTSIVPVSALVMAIAGNEVELHTLLPPNASPHTFEAKPSQVKIIANARVFFMIGAGLENWAKTLIKANVEGNLIVVELSKGLDLIGFSGSGEEDHHHHNHMTSMNPHVWLDPLYALKMSKTIRDVLIKIDPENSPIYNENFNKFSLEIKTLHKKIQETLSVLENRNYISFHPAWVYFAKRYGLKSMGVIEDAPGREPTPLKINRIVNNIKTNNVAVIFADSGINSKTADIIAVESGARIVFLDPLGGAGCVNKDGYFNLINYNLEQIKKGYNLN